MSEKTPPGDGPRESGSGKDRENSRFSRRMARYARVGSNVGGIAAKYAGQRFLGLDLNGDANARELKAALGGLKGPIMKVAQMMATIPEALPADYAEELSQLQSAAPPMGRLFVKRRMMAELGAGWQGRFGAFEKEAAAAASLGQVHKAADRDGTPLACKLQYPDMQSAVEADLRQLDWIFSLYRRLDPVIDPREMAGEIGARLREELDYDLEARHIALYADMLAGEERIEVPEVRADLSTHRLLTMTWLEGTPLLDFRQAPLEARNAIAEAMFAAWWHPFSRFGVIHGDPHLGNYTVRADHGINLLDFGCIRKFPPAFVSGVIELYRALETDDRDRAVAAYESWGFKNLSHDLVDILNMWAGFIYGPMLDDRVRTVADGIKPGEYGRKQAFAIHKALKEHGPVTPPREFVFMDRAAIGLGGVFLHLDAELNFYRLFNEAIEGFDPGQLEKRQAGALKKAGLALP